MKKKYQLLLVLLMICVTMCFASAIHVAAATPAKPTITVVKKSTDTSVWIKWAQAKNAKKYELFCSVDGGAYKKIAVTMKLYYKHTGLKPGSTYSYKLRASNGTNKSKYSAVKKYKVPKKNVYKASTNSVYLTKTQNSKRITVTYSGPSCTVQFKSSDTSVADCEWDEDWIGDTIGLTITGYKKGSCTITLTNTADSQKVQIYVDVDFPTSNSVVTFDTDSLVVKVGETKTVPVYTDNGCSLQYSYSSKDPFSVSDINWISGTSICNMGVTGKSSGIGYLTVMDKLLNSISSTLKVYVVRNEEESEFWRIASEIEKSPYVDSEGYHSIMIHGTASAGGFEYTARITYQKDIGFLTFTFDLGANSLENGQIEMMMSSSDAVKDTESFYTSYIALGKACASNIMIDKTTYSLDKRPEVVLNENVLLGYSNDLDSAKELLGDIYRLGMIKWQGLLGQMGSSWKKLGYLMIE